jgi:peroxidase
LIVTTTGAHTIGQVSCPSYQAHIYNDTNINLSFTSSLKATCLASGGANIMPPLDTTMPNAYYSNLLSHKGLLHSDQELFNGGRDPQLAVFFSSQIGK